MKRFLIIFPKVWFSGRFLWCLGFEIWTWAKISWLILLLYFPNLVNLSAHNVFCHLNFSKIWKFRCEWRKIWQKSWNESFTQKSLRSAMYIIFRVLKKLKTSLNFHARPKIWRYDLIRIDQKSRFTVSFSSELIRERNPKEDQKNNSIKKLIKLLDLIQPKFTQGRLHHPPP